MSLLCSWSLFNVYVIISCTWIFNRGKFCVFLRMVFMCMFAQVEMVKIYMRLKNTSNLCLWIVLIFVSDILRSIQYVNIRRVNIFLQYENRYHVLLTKYQIRFTKENIWETKLKLFQNLISISSDRISLGTNLKIWMRHILTALNVSCYLYLITFSWHNFLVLSHTIIFMGTTSCVVIVIRWKRNR